MSIEATVRRGVETAFRVAADFVSVGSYHVRTGAGSYDPVTDQLTGGVQVLAGVRMLRTTMQTEEREASALAVTDVKVLIPGVDLRGHTPTESDMFVLDSREYNVTVPRPVPGGSVWIMFGRQR